MRGIGGRGWAVVFVLAVLAAAVGVPTAVAAAGSGASPGGAAVPETVAGTQLDPDSVLMRVTVHENGSATWAIEYRVRFDDDASREAFDAVAANVSTDPVGFAAPFRDRMTATVASAERATGREMDLRDVSVTAGEKAVPQPHGVVTYRFTWRGFAAVYGDRIEVGDALSGLVLDEETTLLVDWPEGYDAASVAPAPEDDGRANAAAWSGPLAFGGDEPSLTLTAAGALPVPLPALGVVAVAAALGAGVVWRRRRGREPGETAVPPTPPAAETSPATETSTAAGRNAAADAGAAAGAGPAATSDDVGGAPSPGDGGSPDPDLLSNEERVLTLLRERGGRMKQQDIVSVMEWTEAKTSRVVADLRESGEAEVFRLGRENVVSLPDEGAEETDGS